MATARSSDDTPPAIPDIDANGVDRVQIRAMLALTPEERLRRVEEFVEGALGGQPATSPPAPPWPRSGR